MNTNFSLDFEQQKLILQETEYVTLFLLYLWAKYEPIWPNLTGKTVIFSAYGFLTAIYYFQFTKNLCFDSRIQSYGLIFRPHVMEK